jgi:DNA polymerase IV (DinB-like DNA polymerase)
VDLDSFYPSVEKRNDPSLEGKPLVVGGDPARKRGVVVSCSYEARKLGIHAGQPISRAYRLAPKAIYLRPNFALYSKVSKRVMNLLRAHADSFEQVSIDEAFLDVSSRGTYDSASSLAHQIKDEIKGKEGLSCSIGIAPNKSSAKIASDFQKPNGLTVVPQEKLAGFLAPLPVRAITGVGKKTEEFLASIGVNTIGDLQKLPGTTLTKHFGKTGVWLWGVAHGLEQIPVKERTLMKSLSAEHTFENDVEYKIALEKMHTDLVDTLHKRIESAGYEFRVVSIKIGFSYFETFTRENTLPNFTASKNAIIEEANNLMEEFEKEKKKKIRLIGVRVADLRRRSANSPSLSDWLS